AGVGHEYGKNGHRSAHHRVDGEDTIVHALDRVEEHEEGRRRVSGLNGEVVLPRRERNEPARLPERDRVPPPAVHKDGERRSAANGVEDAQLRRLWRRRAATAVTRPERENGDHGDEQAAVHVDPRSTTYTLRCAVGTMIRSRMFTCSGRFTM